ncbi:DUF1657 domain-containing protein [Salibacterium salarium]|uniref:DUF1657 domain-containing protein n=1 Tax=Salibacterium salarium TaxID=284579 RepID=A0A428N0Z6_9BACI|nr:DUF1657 domain-containing protein [Salibacterium salarium]RSL31942.1 DUF1657 domain-containing protein [Salibacterium salarium]
MTVASNVKQCLSSIKNVEGSLSSLEQRTQDEKDKQTIRETKIVMEEIKEDLKKRVGKIEREEDQYKGF